MNHARTAGREDQLDLRSMHQLIGQFDGRLVDPSDDIFRSAGCHCRLKHKARGDAGALAGARVRTDDDAVARLQTDQRLENRSRCRIRGRNDAADQPHGLGNSNRAGLVILAQNTAGLLVLVFVVNVLGRKMILDDLIFDNSHSRLFYR